ncbi:hypothetical protein ACVWXQ_004290 [Bradyrhizobium sp. S3.14.4]
MDGQAFDFDDRVDFDDRIGDDDIKAEEQVLTLDTICVSKFSKLKLPPRKNVLDPILPERGLAMLFAGRGIGKTHVALGIAYAVSCGGEFLRWRAERACNVLYVDGEMPQEALQDRLLATMKEGRHPPDGAFRLLCIGPAAVGDVPQSGRSEAARGRQFASGRCGVFGARQLVDPRQRRHGERR